MSDLHDVFAKMVKDRDIDLWTERRPSGQYRYEVVGNHYKGFEMGYVLATIHAVAAILKGGPDLLNSGSFVEFVTLSVVEGGCNAAEIAEVWAHGDPV
jgi:hypothetical protein